MAKSPIGLIALTLAVLCPALLAQGQAPPIRLDTIKLPPGFSIEVFASDVTNARSMVRSPSGTLFVGSRRIGVGNVYALPDRNNDNKADEVIVIAKGLNMPNGLAFREGSLYVADTSRLLRYDNIEAQLKSPPAPVVLYENFPNIRLHQWHFIGFGPDGMLYVPIGSPCTDYCDPTVAEYKNPQNEVIPADKRFASIMRMKPDGTGQEIFATGVRNTVGFDWHPVTKELWFTENSRDSMGAELPDDELNRAPRSGLHFGYPYCHAGTVQDPAAPATAGSCAKFEAPAQNVGPHVAPLGMRFYTGSMFPAEYRNQIIIAEHGNIPGQRPGQPKVGYRLTLARLDSTGTKVVKYEPFAEGWLQPDGTVWGRPADVLVMPDGSLLVSDDQANVIYRISYSRPGRSTQ
jgi:glucose/arabinose dehydrogenase